MSFSFTLISADSSIFISSPPGSKTTRNTIFFLRASLMWRQYTVTMHTFCKIAISRIWVNKTQTHPETIAGAATT